MTKDDTAVFHAFAWNPVKAEYDDWRGMGTRAAIAARTKLTAQGLDPPPIEASFSGPTLSG